jgi:predicted acyl esterase
VIKTLLIVNKSDNNPTKGFFDVSLVQNRDGVPLDRVSGFQSFEAPDPALWTALGYAVINVDARGIFKSGGNHRYRSSRAC